jgi:DNA repair protein RecO
VIGSDRGLVLRTYKLRETSQIVSLLAHAHGRLRLVANGSRGGRHRFGASLEVGNEIDLVFALPPGRELGTVREATLRQAWLAGARRLEVVATGLAVVELLDRVVPEGAQDPGLLHTGLAALAAQRTSADRAGAVLAFLRFELALLGQLGLQPALVGCVRCGRATGDAAWLDLRAGALVCGRCTPAGRAMRLEAPAVALLGALASGTPPPAPPAPAARRAAGLALHRLLSTHVERYRYPRALALLKKVDTSAANRSRPGAAMHERETP